MLKSGIYAFINLIDAEIYVGQAFTFKRRWTGHVSALNLNTHANPYFQAAWNKHGEDNFIIIILEYVERDKELLKDREQYWMDKYKAANREFGYNYAPAAGSNVGRKFTPETLAKLAERSAKLKGIPRSPEVRAKIAAGNKGRVHSPETLEKMRLAKLGTKRSVESREARSKAMMGDQRNKGRKQSPEEIEIRRASNTGKKRTPEQRKRMSDSMKGREVSIESRVRMSISALNRKK